jgi:CRP-like cAMP-binding protein
MATSQCNLEPPCIGHYLPCSPTDIEHALAVQAHERSVGNAISIGQILLARELITSETLRAALDKQRLERLYRSSLMANLSEQQLELVAGIAEEIGLSAGEILFTQDVCGDSLYVVTSGRILLSRHRPLDGDQPIAVALPGDILGEASFLSKKERSCTAWAIEPAMLLKIRYELLSSLGGLSRNFPGRSLERYSSLSRRPAGVNADAWIANISSRIAIRVTRAMKGENAFVYIRRPHAGDFLAYVMGHDGYRIFRAESGMGIVGEAATTGELIKLADPYFDPRFAAEIDVWTGQWTRTFMAGPMRNANNMPVGVLQVINKANGLFDQDDETIFRAVACQFASTIEMCGATLAAKA